MNTMDPETRSCKNCKKDFAVEPEDFDFYGKIGVSAPTFCPDCRLQRRMVLRNERTLYKRTCDLCKKTLIGIYPEGTPFPVYCSECWWSDKWDPEDHAMEYDFERPFFAQWKELQDRVPRQHTNNTVTSTIVNSVYTNCAGDMKNCYLVFGAMNDEDSMYSHYLNYSRSCVDGLYVLNSEHCYECVDVEQCNNVRWSQSCVGCRDSAFLFDCRNCNDCIGCVGLRNKQYHIFNKPYSKEEYLKEKEGLGLGSRAGIGRFRERFMQELYYKLPRKYYHGQMNKDSTGDYLSNSERTKSAFYTKNARGSKYVFWAQNVNDVYDYFAWGDMELCYECVSGGYGMHNCKFTHTCWTELRDVDYSSLCFTGSDLFGCIGLRNKRFCVLNTQYSEAEYRAMRTRILAQMDIVPYRDAQGIEYRYGENFPIELSPFAYADTVAQEHFPLSPDEIATRGYGKQGTQDHANTIPTRDAGDLPDSIKDVPDAILDEVIGCAHKGSCAHQCSNAFRIIPAELEYYRHKDIPLPTLCHNCRHGERVALRNPLRLWHRKCRCSGARDERGLYVNRGMHSHGKDACPNEFETSYAPDRPEIVYCEQCYNSEIA